VTPTLVRDPTIQQQHSHIAHSLSIQAKEQGSKEIKPNNLCPARQVQTALPQGCTETQPLWPAPGEEIII